MGSLAGQFAFGHVGAPVRDIQAQRFANDAHLDRPRWHSRFPRAGPLAFKPGNNLTLSGSLIISLSVFVCCLLLVYCLLIVCWLYVGCCISSGLTRRISFRLFRLFHLDQDPGVEVRNGLLVVKTDKMPPAMALLRGAVHDILPGAVIIVRVVITNFHTIITPRSSRIKVRRR